MALISSKPLLQSVLVRLDGGELGTVMFGDRVAKCYCGKIGWCDHVEQVVADRRDMLAHILIDSGGGIVTIPLFPSMGIWVPILFRQIGSAQMWKAEIDDVDIEAALGNSEELFLGVINVDDTRLTVRSMVLQWFKQFLTKNVVCESTSHGMMEVKAYKHALDTNDQVYLQSYFWRTRWTGMCPGCYDRMQASLTVVPDAEPIRSPWS